MFYSHVTIMIIVGFGFLMTFLKRHGYGSVSYNFMLAAFVFMWNMFVRTPPAPLPCHARGTVRTPRTVSRLWTIFARAAAGRRP